MSPPDAFLADFLARARARLLPSPPAVPTDGLHAAGDHIVSPGLEAEAPAGPGTPAAVLVPVIARPGGATLLLTRRSTRLRSHSGQIAFPGGRIDQSDDGPLAAALREAQEEIGLDAALVAPLGYLDAYLTSSGFSVVAVVALVVLPPSLRINPDEVDEAFECPLAFLMDAANHRRESREWRGALRSYYAMPYGDRYIWGVTAGILRALHDRIYG